MLFEVGSALCGGAPNMDALIVGRVIAGIGGSGIYLGVLNYLSVTTTSNERGAYIALIGMVWGLGMELSKVPSSKASIRVLIHFNIRLHPRTCNRRCIFSQ